MMGNDRTDFVCAAIISIGQSVGKLAVVAGDGGGSRLSRIDVQQDGWSGLQRTGVEECAVCRDEQAVAVGAVDPDPSNSGDQMIDCVVIGTYPGGVQPDRVERVGGVADGHTRMCGVA